MLKLDQVTLAVLQYQIYGRSLVAFALIVPSIKNVVA
jgi:hypothetical protein